jgi:hypothetical protein
MKNTLSGKWIWLPTAEADSYAEFSLPVSVGKGRKITLAVASEGHFAAYIDENLVLFSQSGAYPNAPLYDECAVSRFLADGGGHTLRILSWHPGVDSSCYISDAPGLWFELRADGQAIFASDAGIACRKVAGYKAGYKKVITVQLGLSFFYDSTAAPAAWESAVSADRPQPKKRSISPLRLLPLAKAAAVTRTDRGTYLFDLGEERAGFLSLDLLSDADQLLTVSYGEHLVDGHVPRLIGGRDFSVEYKAHKGRNVFLHPLRRLAGRYLEVAHEAPITVSHFAIREVSRRFSEKKKSFSDPLLQKIYDTSVNTLRLSVHEHYEDCPWREQSTYLLDSRNQMLCGYTAFRGAALQRHHVLFFAEGQMENGFFPLCFPTKRAFAIPSFSLCFPRVVRDYVAHTGDRSVLPLVRPAMEKMLAAFASRIDESGLIPRFPYPFWNFYEWSEGSDNDHDLHRTPEEYTFCYDLALNGMYVLACRDYAALYGGESAAEGMLGAIKNAFFVEEKGYFRMSTGSDRGSVLANSIAVLCGIGNESVVEKMLTDESLVPITLSMHTYFYDALLQTNVDYSSYIIEDIKKKYGRMLAEGATTFWETEKGWEDFDGAGSLCHGWSAIPVYYLCRLLLGEKPSFEI